MPEAVSGSGSAPKQCNEALQDLVPCDPMSASFPALREEDGLVGVV